MTHSFEFSLSVGTGLVPFALSSNERKMAPEEWAWRFLRLNQDYQKAYSDALEKQQASQDSQNGSTRFHEAHHLRKIFVDERDCRDRFGLSTWLDPSLNSLPVLPEGQSWFAPLRAVSVDLPRTISIQNGLFGLLSERPRPRQIVEVRVKGQQATIPLRSAEAVFSIDCRVPIDGQLASVSFLAEQYAKLSRTAGLKASSFECIPADRWLDAIPLQDGTTLFCDLHRASKSLLKKLGNDVNKNRIDLVKQISVNLARPPSGQLKKWRMHLLAYQEWLIGIGLVAIPIKRLWLRLAMTSGRKTGSPSDGHRLKAYVMISECHLAKISNRNEILRILKAKGAQSAQQAASLSDDWTEYLHGRAERIDAYAAEAKAYISANYMWLVHSQNPVVETEPELE